MKKIGLIPRKMRIDNAANIYPASLSKHYASLYRLSISLSAQIRLPVLAQALDRVSARIPSFRCTLTKGSFWWYLSRQEEGPQVLPLAPLSRAHFMCGNTLLYRVSADGCRIVLDVFHVLTDGNGALTFLLSLAAEYLRLQYNAEIPASEFVLAPSEDPKVEEFEDSFKRVFHGKKGKLEKNDDAYHLPDERLKGSALLSLRASLPEDEVLDAARRMGCTVTELLVSALLFSIQEEHRRDSDPRKKNVLKVSVPVNLRPRYGSRTLRNFSSYINMGIDVSAGYLEPEDIIRRVAWQKREGLRTELFESKIAANVELEEMLIVRCIPLFIKKHVIDLINRLHGDRYFSTTLSNLGKVPLPAGMRPYVHELDFALGRQRKTSGAAACVSCNGHLVLTLTRDISSDAMERRLLALLGSWGISAAVTEERLA